MNKYKVEAIQNISDLFKKVSDKVNDTNKDSRINEDTDKFQYRLKQRINRLFKTKRLRHNT